jgi:uncharacterized protein HemX
LQAKAGGAAAKESKALDSQLKAASKALKEKEAEARELDSQLMSLKNQMREMQLSFSDDYSELEMSLKKALIQLEIASENESGAALMQQKIKSLELELESFAGLLE